MGPLGTTELLHRAPLALCTTCGRWRAAHLALLHLFKDQLQRLSPGQHAFDIHPLFARDVIEFKHYRVRLAAGHATCSTPTEIRTPFPEVKTPDPNP